MFALESFVAHASVVADSIQASSAVLAWERRAVIGVDRAVFAFVAFGAQALIRSVDVLAGCPVSAR